MNVAFLITNGGPHPPEKWAEVTADQIVGLIQIDPDSPNAASYVFAKQEFKLKLMHAMLGVHRDLQEHERDELKRQGCKRCNDDSDPCEHVDAGVQTVTDVAKGTMFEAYFDPAQAAAAPVLAFVRATIIKHMATSMQIERSWHADKNKNDPDAKEFHRRQRDRRERKGA